MTTSSHLQLHDFMGWSCDICHGLITSTGDGWVEWLASDDENGCTFIHHIQLVHRQISPNSCRYDYRAEFRRSKSIVEGLPLENLVGPDGLMNLLSLLAVDEFPKIEAIELTKRLQIPGYELIRNLISDESSERPRAILGEGFYLQSELRDLALRAVEQLSFPQYG
jgi:hypothetical protein